MDHLEEIKARLTIEDVVSQYIQLQKAGRNFKGLCPFHNEKTPSFMVSPDKGLAYCFGCQKGGDIFKFVQLIENIEFPEAVKILAERAGVKLPTFSKESQEKKTQTFEINEEVTRFYQENLVKNREKKEYLIQRGVNEAIINAFRLGYAPDSFEETYKFLLTKGFSKAEIVNSGLAGSKDTNSSELYDRFRGRIIFPITNVLGKVIAFGGRTLKEEKTEAKYLNSPDSPTYNKSLVLYALDKAKESIRQLNQVIIVEGYMDVIASHQAGIKNVVASSGTALTKEQIKLLKRYTQNFIFAFDTDEAGKNAARRAIDLAIESDVNIRIAIVPNGKDPDECIRADLDLWKKTLKEAVSVVDFTLKDLIQRFDLKTIEGKKKIIQEILPLIKKYPNTIEKEEYLKYIANFLQVNEKTLRTEMLKTKVSNLNNNEEHQNISKKIISREKFLLGLILNFPQFYNLIAENLIEKIFLDTETKTFYKKIENAYNPLRIFNANDFIEKLDKEEKNFFDLCQLFAEEKYGEIPEESVGKEVKILIREINKANLMELKNKLILQLKESKQKDKNQYLLLLNQYNQILKLKL